MLGDVALSIGYAETVQSILPLLEPLSRDTEAVVKQHLGDQLKILAKFCIEQGGEDGYKTVRDKILPVAANLLEDEKQEVRQSASMALVEIASHITMDDLGQYVLTIILRLAHEDDKEEMRMTAAQLLNLLAECLGHDLCRQFVIPEVVSLAEDPVFRVRKSTALNFHSICKVGGEHELLERLMPAFVRLSKDDMYRVRRACAESLSEISKNVGEDIRLGVLVEIFLRLTHDPSKLVKQTILQQSGTFIATLPSRAVNDNILGQYISMASNPTGDVAVDSELRHICAYSFPAVMSVVGKNRWRELRELYHKLAQTPSASIKQTLAYSLHEIARMLEDELLVEEELVPVFEDLIQENEVVQLGVIKNLAAFLQKLPELCRVSYLPVLHEILHTTNPFNWRLRQYLAMQLSKLVALPKKPEVYKTLFPTIMTLLQDPVASVRRETFQGVSSFVLAIYEVAHNVDQRYTEAEVIAGKKNLAEITRAINQFITSPKCYIRQLWMELARQLLKDLPAAFFESEFLAGVLKLTLDRVLNVRLAVAMFLAGWGPEYPAPWDEDDFPDAADDNQSEDRSASSSSNNYKKSSPWIWLLKRTDMKECVRRLSKDDRDVYLHVSQLRILYPDIEFKMMSCRGRKIPPGGAEIIVEDASEVPKADPTLLESALRQEEARRRSASECEVDSQRDRSSSVDALAEETLSVLSGTSRSATKSLRNETGEEDVDMVSPEERVSMSSVSSSNTSVIVETLEEIDRLAQGAAHGEPEHEFIPSMFNSESIQDLDIIDGIMPSPTHAVHSNPVPFSFRTERSFADEDDDEVDEAEEARIKAGIPLNTDDIDFAVSASKFAASDH
jgi:serine/threonine-protein phosphatase 4 regulatory subunit 1